MKVADTQDLDPQETREWLDALSAVRGHRGNDRAGSGTAQMCHNTATQVMCTTQEAEW